MRKHAYSVIFLIVLLLVPASCLAAGKVVIVTLNRAGLEQAAANQSMAPWLTEGSVALLNIGTAARSTSGHIYVTTGAGSRATAPESVKLAFNAEEEYTGAMAAQVFERHLGRIPAGEVLHLGMVEIGRANSVLPYPVQPGLLGDTLRQGGKVTAIIGNADGVVVNREAAALLADSRGQIDLGDVGKDILKRDERFPFGWRLERDIMLERFLDIYPKADVVLVDWGDFARLDEYRKLLRDAVANELAEEIFSDVAWFLSRVWSQLDPEDTLLLLFPAPAPAGGVDGQFGMMAVLGRQYPPGGLLTSATTRRQGIAAVTDVAPLVLERVGLSTPGGMLGRPVSVGGPGGMPVILRMQKEIVRTFLLRPPLMKTYVLFQIVIVLGALFNLLVRIVAPRTFEAPLLGLLTVPLLLLYLPLHKVSVVVGFVLTGVAVVMVVFLLQYGLKEPLQRFAAVAVATSVSIVVDIWRNASLMKISVLGYDAISGARYYGLGNEYMGVLVGTTILGAVSVLTLLPRSRRFLLPFIALYFFAALLLIIAPGGGANFGGTVTALVAFLVTLAVLAKIKPGWRSSLAVLTGLAIIAGIAIYFNLRVPEGDQSHLGRTLALMEQDGFQTLRDVASRKASMNIRLFRYSQWSRAFLAFLSVLAVLFFRPYGVLRDLRRLYPQLAAGFLGIIAGSITAMLTNDSGVVAAATTLLYAGVPIILLASRRVEENTVNVGEDK